MPPPLPRAARAFMKCWMLYAGNTKTAFRRSWFPYSSKALLVHGAKQDDDARKAITAALKTRDNSRQFKR